MARCAGIKRDGGRCAAIVDGSFCYQHDPARAEERRRAASRAGKSKPSRELASVKRQLQELADGVLDGGVDRAAAAVVGQLLNVLLRAVELGRKIKETEELEDRIEQLERAQEQRGGKRWGA